MKSRGGDKTGVASKAKPDVGTPSTCTEDSVSINFPSEECASAKADNPAVSSDDMRKAMSSWPTGVAVITVQGEGGDDSQKHGMTVSSLSSVSLEPAILSFSTRADSRTLKMAQESGSFGVNILSQEQQKECWNFCGTEGDRFEEVAHSQGSLLNVPLLEGASSYMECEVAQVIPVTEDRVLVLGKVVATEGGQNDAPLVNFDGKMGAFSLA